MRTRRTALAAGACAAALVLASGASAFAAPKPDAHQKADKPAKAAVAVTKLQIVNVKKVRDVATADAVIRAHVQVKDHSKKFSPDSVTLKVVQKSDTGEVESTLVVDAVRKGKSKVVTNWLAKITVPQGSVAPGETATYCIRVVKALDATVDAPLASTKAKGLAGRDCVTVTNSATA